MENLKPCVCPQLDETPPLFDIESPSTSPEDTDVEEIDENELIEDKLVPHNIIWQEIENEFYMQRKQIEDYLTSKQAYCDLQNPTVQFVEDNVFTTLKGVMVDTINKAKELECIKHEKSIFNGVDFIAEMMWNKNPLHPERKENWTYLFDMDWVVKWLKEKPHFPLSYIWTKDYSANKIQAWVRGHWVRCRDDVQEMRQFWKVIRKENNDKTETNQDSTSLKQSIS